MFINVQPQLPELVDIPPCPHHLCRARGRAEDKRVQKVTTIARNQCSQRRTSLAISTKLFVDGCFVLMRSPQFLKEHVDFG